MIRCLKLGFINKKVCKNQSDSIDTSHKIEILASKTPGINTSCEMDRDF